MVVNAIGVVKQGPGGDDPVLTEAVNTRFPHLVAERTVAAGAALIHLSTDCVFDGRAGSRTESDPVTATDAARSVEGRGRAGGSRRPGAAHVDDRPGASGSERAARVVPRSARTGQRVPPGLLLGAHHTVLADLIVQLARRPVPLTGLFHVAADPIDKASLLSLLVPYYRPGIEVIALDQPVIDRTLDGQRFAAAVRVRGAVMAGDDRVAGR